MILISVMPEIRSEKAMSSSARSKDVRGGKLVREENVNFYARQIAVS